MPDDWRSLILVCPKCQRRRIARSQKDRDRRAGSLCNHCAAKGRGFVALNPNPKKLVEATEPDIERFMSFVEKLKCGCWYWTGARSRGKGNKKWYGSFCLNGKTVRAHRFAAEVLGHQEKPLDPGQHRDHTCGFSMCVNPDHIEVVTREENQRRKMNGNGKEAGSAVRELPALPSRGSHEARWPPEC